MTARVIHMTSVHDPSDGRIMHKECASLAESGYDVVLIAAASRPSGRVGSVELDCVGAHTGRLRRMTVGVVRVLRAALGSGGDLFHFHDPELLPAGLLLALLGRVVIYDVHENLVDDVLTKAWIPRWLRGMLARAVGAFEVWAASRLAAVVAATPVIAERFSRVRKVVVQNFPLWSEFEQVLRRADEGHTFVYAGVLNEGRGLRQMVEAIGLVAASTDGARLVLAGVCDEPWVLEELQASPAWRHVKFVGWQERERVRELLASATAGLVVLQPLQSHMDAQPTKLFEYMAAGLPVIASDFERWRRFIQDDRVGLLVSPDDPHEIAEAMSYLVDNPIEGRAMGQRGRTVVTEHFTWDVEYRKLAALYEQLIGPPLTANGVPTSSMPHSKAAR